MSPKLSSLAFDEIPEQDRTLMGFVDFEPELSVVKPRHQSRSHEKSSPASFDEVVHIGGRFTISF